MLWVELCLFKKYLEVLPSQHIKCNLIWKLDLGTCSQGKMKSLGQTLIQYGRSPGNETTTAEANLHGGKKM